MTAGIISFLCSVGLVHLKLTAIPVSDQVASLILGITVTLTVRPNIGLVTSHADIEQGENLTDRDFRLASSV